MLWKRIDGFGKVSFFQVFVCTVESNFQGVSSEWIPCFDCVGIQRCRNGSVYRRFEEQDFLIKIISRANDWLNTISLG